MAEKIIVLDFGGQYKQLIARRVRENHVYAEILPNTTPIEKLRDPDIKGIILTGGPDSVYLEDSPSYDPELYTLGVPVLGICYGAQLMAYQLGGQVKTAPVSEYGSTEVEMDSASTVLLKEWKKNSITWMSHTDYIAVPPEGFEITAHTPVCPVAGMENREKNLYAVQFHPEVEHTEEGQKLFKNFIYDVCKCEGTWKMDSFVETSIKELREKIGNGRV